VIAPAEKLLIAGHPPVIGHRGYCGVAPENTLPSFNLALDAGADLIELDYHHTEDGVPIVIHDATLDRTTDARKRWGQSRIRVAEKSARQIQTLDAGSWFNPQFAGARIPSLTEALDFICGHGVVALIEHKSGDAETLVALLCERKLINHVVVISFDWKFLREFHALDETQILGALGPPIRSADGRKPSGHSKKLCARSLDELEETGARIVVWNRRISKASVQRAHERGLKVWIYTVDDPKLAKQLLDIGVDGIITNHPPLIRNVVASRRGRTEMAGEWENSPNNRIRALNP